MRAMEVCVESEAATSGTGSKLGCQVGVTLVVF